MHASDRTLLASLGFADKDKASGRHTQACNWVATNDGAKAVFDGAGLDPFHGWQNGWSAIEDPVFESAHGWTEVHLGKGSGQYRSTIGFIDAVIQPVYSHLVTVEREKARQEGGGVEKTEKRHQRRGLKVGVEVKISREDVGAIVRQINLYREYADHDEFRNLWVLIADYDMSESEVAALQSASIRTLRLGERFRAFCEAGSKIATVTSL